MCRTFKVLFYYLVANGLKKKKKIAQDDLRVTKETHVKNNFLERTKHFL